jgi:hypothetical protein
MSNELDCANESEADHWQVWYFVAGTDKLVLCGYREVFDVIGYLVFSGTTHITLPKWLDKAEFHIEDASQPGHNRVMILQDDLRYSITCEKVGYYPVEGAGKQ